MEELKNKLITLGEFIKNTITDIFGSALNIGIHIAGICFPFLCLMLIFTLMTKPIFWLAVMSLAVIYLTVHFCKVIFNPVTAKAEVV